MSAEDAMASAVAQRVRLVLGWPDIKPPPRGYPDSLALCVTDAIWSVNVKYAGVAAVVDRYRRWVAQHERGSADERTLRDFIDDVHFAGGEERFACEVVSNRTRTSPTGGVRKSAAALEAATKLVKLDVDTAADLRARHNDPIVKAAWKSVHGQRRGVTWHYLGILAGVEDVKADRMICRFVADAVTDANLNVAVTAQSAYNAMVAARTMLADDHSVTLRQLDHAVWNWQRAR